MNRGFKLQAAAAARTRTLWDAVTADVFTASGRTEPLSHGEGVAFMLGARPRERRSGGGGAFFIR